METAVWFSLEEARAGRDHAYGKHPSITLSLDCLQRLGNYVLQTLKQEKHPPCKSIIQQVARELRWEEQPAARCAIAKMLSSRSVVHRKAHQHETPELFAS